MQAVIILMNIDQNYQPQTYYQIYSELTQPYPNNNPLEDVPHFQSEFINSKLTLHKPRYSLYNRQEYQNDKNIEKEIEKQLIANDKSNRENHSSHPQKIHRKGHLWHLSDQYRQNNILTRHTINPECFIQGQRVSVKPPSTAKPLKRTIHSAFSTRSEPFLESNQFTKSTNSPQKRRAQSSRSSTPGRAASAETCKYMKKHPLVVYPFESKLKIKRVDDNPKMLERVIASKVKNAQRQQLYTFINKLMLRRAK